MLPKLIRVGYKTCRNKINYFKFKEFKEIRLQNKHHYKLFYSFLILNLLEGFFLWSH